MSDSSAEAGRSVSSGGSRSTAGGLRSSWGSGVAIGVGLSWILLHGTAMASRRIRLAAGERVSALLESVGWCGRPPRDQSRQLAAIGIMLMVGVWIVLPTLVAISLAA